MIRKNQEDSMKKKQRAEVFACRLAATGLSLSEFAKEAGFTRNVIYNLSIGQKPRNEDQAERLETAFERLRDSISDARHRQ